MTTFSVATRTDGRQNDLYAYNKICDSYAQALPNEVLGEIFKYLDIPELSTAALVNKQWRMVARSDIIWSGIAEKIGYSPSEMMPRYQQVTAYFGPMRNSLIKSPSHTCLVKSRPTIKTMQQYKAWKEEWDVTKVWSKLDEDIRHPMQPPGKLEGQMSAWINRKISNLEYITELNLSKMELSKIPEAICSLTDLKSLKVANNMLTEIPEEIGKLSNLIELSLDGNLLKNLPDSVGGLKDLVFLDLEKNNFDHVPEVIKELKDLRFLRISQNHLTLIPDWVGSLQEERNCIYDSPFSGIQSTIAETVALHHIFFSHNQITDLPKTIEGLETLKNLVLEGNPLSQSAHDIISRLREKKVRVIC